MKRRYLKCFSILGALSLSPAMSMEADLPEEVEATTFLHRLDESSIEDIKLMFNLQIGDSIDTYLKKLKSDGPSEELYQENYDLIRYMEQGWDINSPLFYLSMLVSANNFNLGFLKADLIEKLGCLEDMHLSRNSVGYTSHLPEGVTTEILRGSFTIFPNIKSIRVEVREVVEALVGAIQHAHNLECLEIEVALSIEELERLQNLPIREFFFNPNNLTTDNDWLRLINILKNWSKLESLNFNKAEVSRDRIRSIVLGVPSLKKVNGLPPRYFHKQ